MSAAPCTNMPWWVSRRVVQVHLSTSEVDIELSQYIKRELHSLHNYLLTSFTSQDIAAFSKHFAKVKPTPTCVSHTTDAHLGCSAHH